MRSQSPGAGALNGWCAGIGFPRLLIDLEIRKAGNPRKRKDVRIAQVATVADFVAHLAGERVRKLAFVGEEQERVAVFAHRALRGRRRSRASPKNFAAEDLTPSAPSAIQTMPFAPNVLASSVKRVEIAPRERRAARIAHCDDRASGIDRRAKDAELALRKRSRRRRRARGRKRRSGLSRPYRASAS